MACEQSNIQLRIVHGDIKNQHPKPLDLMKSHDWFGHVMGSYPQCIKSGDSAQFNHDGIGPNGSKATVIYTVPDTNPDLNPNTQVTFLVAWWRSPISIAKAYVKVGTRMTFEHIKWSEIEDELNKSGQESHYLDPYTRTSATAKIGYNGIIEVQFGNGLHNST